jgi:hypothetical protein
MNPIFVTANRISNLLNLHHDTTKKYLKVLNVPSYRVGKRLYYKTVEVLPLLKEMGITS